MNKSDSDKYTALCDEAAARLEDSLKALRHAGVERQSSSGSNMSRESQLKKAIWDAVTALEKTKHSFRSKQIEKIKNDLLQVLMEE